MSKFLVVLAPNGRRQTVKCTLNTTILQTANINSICKCANRLSVTVTLLVLEEVCMKQGFDPSQYDLKHYNKVLDVTNTIRFSNLPNKATLEMVEAERRREESVVTIALQLDTDERRLGDFSSQSTLYAVVEALANAELAACRHATVVYMRHDVHDEDLRCTTLRQLGLTGGRAVLRLVDKALEQLKTQANVSSVISSQPVRADKPTASTTQTPTTSHSEPAEPVAGPSGVKQYVHISPGHNPVKLIHDEMRRKANFNVVDEGKDSEDAWSTLLDTTSQLECPSLQSAENTHLVDGLDEELLKRRLNIEQEVNFLGEHKAIAFVQSTLDPELSELPDEFYELTVDEVRQLYCDLQQSVSAVTEAPLLTAQQRSAKQTLKQRGSSHKHVVVRVQFPDRTVLQGVFTPADTIQHVHTFTGQHLKQPHRPFHLYTTPTRKALDLKLSLEEAGFVPCVLMHFRWADDGVSESPFLSDHVSSNFTSSHAAAILASKYRASARRKHDESNEQSSQPVAGTSFSKDGKLPKWYKLGS